MALQKLRLASLKLFGRFPKTEEFEAKDKALREEYDEYNRFGQSKEYEHFLEIKNYVESGEPSRIKEELKLLKYPGSEEHLKELEYKRLSKDKALKNYFRVKESETLNQFKSVELSGKPLRFKELKEIVESPDYQRHRSEHKKNNSDEFQHELEYISLKKDRELKTYLKLQSWKPLKDYFELEDSDLLNNFLDLEKHISSQEFIERKAYLLSKDKFEQTDAYKKLSEYKELSKSEKIIWFLGLVNSTKFDEIKRWELTFVDDFSVKKLDAQKWIPRYFWGEAILNKSYSLAADHHFYSDGNNLEIENSTLKIVTKKEEAEGLAWDLRLGFVPKTFSYTSGIICTGQAFRQMYGRFEAKVRFTKAPGVYHAFWLVGDKMLPHIDVFRQNGKKGSTLQGSLFTQNGAGRKPISVKSTLGGFNFDSNFFILSIDWLPNKMIWKINGIPYLETDKNLPDFPAYLVISSGVVAETNDSLLPATLEVDWVKCWKEKELTQQ